MEARLTARGDQSTMTGAIDCDIHPGVPDIKALLPYMNDFWRHSFVDRGIDGFDMMSFPLGAPITCRPDWRVAGERPGSSLGAMRSQALDRFGIALAICNPLTGGQVAVNISPHRIRRRNPCPFECLFPAFLKLFHNSLSPFPILREANPSPGCTAIWKCPR